MRRVSMGWIARAGHTKSTLWNHWSYRVVAVGLHHRDALGLFDVMHLVYQANAQFLLGAHAQALEQGHRGAEDS